MERFGFCLIDGFAMMSAAAAIEPLRAANMFGPSTRFEIHYLSVSGVHARPSQPAFFETTPIRSAGTDFDCVFVVAGGDPFQPHDPRLFAWLRQLDRDGVALGGISGGAGILATAGVLENRRFTIHWHHLDDLRQRHPDALVERRLFVIDRDRYTCAGGTAPLDMMNALITSRHGSAFAQRISDWFIQTEIRSANAPQQAGVQARYGPLPQAVAEAIELMESHLADPLALNQLSGLVGLSSRQLQRQFQSALGQSVSQTYRSIRLEKAREMAKHTALPAKDVAEIVGFTSPPAFSSAFTAQFGESFRQTRLSSGQRPDAVSGTAV